MDEAEKRRLKKLGKQRVEERSRELEEQLRESNPAPVGSDEWVANYKTGTAHERALRQAPPDRMSEADALAKFVLRTVLERPDIGVPTWYAQCARCRDLLHTMPSAPTSCECGAVKLWMDGDPPLLQGRYAEADLLRIVKLIGRGTAQSTPPERRPWWRFW